jgi:light-regulated signal transduction histidine kinase (bacteriophytochrome)
LWTTISGGKIWKGEVKNKTKDETIYWLDTTIVPFQNEDGKPYQYMTIRSDITSRKKAEDKLQAVNKELEAFSYSVSHDLRAPLRAINGYAEILNEDYGTKLDDEGKRIIEIIRENATRMGILIDDLLSFSRLGRKEIQMTEIDMNEMTEGIMIELSKSMTLKAKIKIDKLHEVKADYGLLRQVMFNLISNAVKYSSKKENPVVEISSEEKNDEIIFSVKDNGAGFDMQYADKLFGVFQRLHSQDEFEGTGVGLAIVQRIISRHNGRSWAEGKVNEGAVFYFSLPKN